MFEQVIPLYTDTANARKYPQTRSTLFAVYFDV
jgi:hypothetical protein